MIVKIGFFRVLNVLPKRSCVALFVVFHFLLFSDFVSAQCYTLGIDPPTCPSGPNALGDITYSVNPCGCNYSTNGPWVYKIGTTLNFTTALISSPLISLNSYTFPNLPAGTYYVRVHYNNNTSKCANSEIQVTIAPPPQ